MTSSTNGTVVKSFGVVITIYNAEKTLEATLESLRLQYDRSWYAVCVLNNCTDNSEKILRRFIKKWGVEPKFHVVEMNTQQGHVPASNAGVAYALSIPSVSHIARLDSDDVWHREKLRKQREFLEANPDVLILGTNMRLIEKVTGQHTSNTNYPLANAEIKDSLLASVNPIGNSSSVFSKEVVYRCGMYDDLFPLSEDFWFWLKASRWFKMANLPECLVDYHYWSNPNYNPNVTRLAAFLMGQVQQHSPLQHPSPLCNKK